MKSRNHIWTGIWGFAALTLLILDAQTALIGAKEGITLCLFTVIPSLFPFFVLSNLINSAFAGQRISFLKPLARWCGIPAGGESLLLLGLIGGYPVGAQCICQSFHDGQLNRKDAVRMLGFCSNAGPAFIFGMASGLFTSQWAAWFLFMIHVISAVAVGLLLPNKSKTTCSISGSSPIGISKSLERGIRTMALVCGWVVVFRVIISFCRRWFLWLLPPEAQIIFTGLLELSNGCVSLYSLPVESLRFLLCACFLGLGGMCVAMQTVSVTKELGTGLYFPGKLLQCGISFLLALPVQYLLFEDTVPMPPYILIFAIAICAISILCLRRKNSSSKFVLHRV